jgi:hypothetical protein
VGEIGNPVGPMQQIEIEVISPEASEARLTGPRDAVSRHMARPHLGDQEHAIALTRDYPADEFLGAVYSAVSISVIPSERPVRSASSFQLPDAFPFQDLPSPGRAPGRWCRRET